MYALAVSDGQFFSVKAAHDSQSLTRCYALHLHGERDHHCPPAQTSSSPLLPPSSYQCLEIDLVQRKDEKNKRDIHFICITLLLCASVGCL